MISKLISAGASLEKSPGLVDRATQSRSTEVLKFLLDSNYSFEPEGNNVFTPLMHAARRDHRETIEFLLDVPAVQKTINNEYRGYTGSFPAIFLSDK